MKVQSFFICEFIIYFFSIIHLLSENWNCTKKKKNSWTLFIFIKEKVNFISWLTFNTFSIPVQLIEIQKYLIHSLLATFESCICIFEYVRRIHPNVGNLYPTKKCKCYAFHPKNFRTLCMDIIFFFQSWIRNHTSKFKVKTAKGSFDE